MVTEAGVPIELPSPGPDGRLAGPAHRVRVLVVDHDPLARAQLRELIAEDASLELVGERTDGRSAVTAIRDGQPDLVLLEVQLPGLDGFEVAAAAVQIVGLDMLPAVVFVSACGEFALRAFETDALDYLVKPVNRERFRSMLARVKRVLATTGSWAVPSSAQAVRRSTARDEGRESIETLPQPIIREPLEGDPFPSEPPPDQLAIRAEGRVRFLPIDDIDWLEAEGDYVRFHVGADQHVQRDTLTRLEARLPRWKFLRIHRSALVNVARICEMQPWFPGDYRVMLRDGTELAIGRSYRARVRRFIERIS
jgi:two-component system, LytTR family, response regulator